ncbi:hypothetical protein J6590_061743 [Homalodisca vitripennis]|nr:hypothetical protein J6590_061743 [Homalodisca vitripennis]
MDDTGSSCKTVIPWSLHLIGQHSKKTEMTDILAKLQPTQSCRPPHRRRRITIRAFYYYNHAESEDLQYPSSEYVRHRAENLLLNRLSNAGVVTRIPPPLPSSRRWLQVYANKKYHSPQFVNNQACQ